MANETRKLQNVQPRVKGGDIVTEVVVADPVDYADLGVTMGREISRFCYVLGYRDKGRALPPCKDSTGKWGYTSPEWTQIQ